MPVPQRFRSAAIGFGVTMGPLLAIACLHYLFVPSAVASIDTDPDYMAWAVPSVRRTLVYIHAIAALIVAAYWLLVATLGGGQFLRIRSANIVLAVSILLVALAMVDWSGVGMPSHALLKGLCPALGLADEGPNIGWNISRCRGFTGNIAGMLFLIGPLILLGASAILRILVSRRR